MWIMRAYRTFKYLWDQDERVDHVMRSTAPAFFADLNRILLEYIYQRICLITDSSRATVRKVDRENLSCLLLNDELTRLLLLSPDMETHTAAMLAYRKFLKPARDRAISHLDMEFVMGTAALGALDEAEIGKFLNAMQAYCDAVGEAVGEGPLDFFCTAQAGDVVDLIQCLEQSMSKRERDP